MSIQSQDNQVFAWLGSVALSQMVYPASFDESYKASFAEHDLVGAKPTLQATGPGLVEQSWKATLCQSLCDVESEIEKLLTMLNGQDAHKLVFGNGKSAGDFVITDLSVSSRQIVNGKITLADIDFKLKEYVESDMLAEKSRQAIENAPALKKSAQLSLNPIDTKITPKDALKKIQTASDKGKKAGKKTWSDITDTALSMKDQAKYLSIDKLTRQ